MLIQLNVGSVDILDIGLEHDDKFGFTVVFDDGERVEVTYEPDIDDPSRVRFSRFAADGTRRKRPTLPLFDSGDPTLGAQVSEIF